MDFNIIAQMIGNVGFPIVCCICLFYYMGKSTQQHAEEIDKIRESLNNNTIALTKLCERIEGRIFNESE